MTTPDRLGAERFGPADPCVWTDNWAGYFQLSRFKFVDGENPSLDLASEQKIMQVPNNRGACCHVAGDIDFDKHNNLWLVTGDDTPAGGGNSGGFGPFNDQKTVEQQTLRVNNATGGTFTLTFNGQTTAPLAVQRDRRADRGGARGALQHRVRRHHRHRRRGQRGQPDRVSSDGAYAADRTSRSSRFDGTGLTGTDAGRRHRPRRVQADLFMPPHVDARRSVAEHQRPARQDPPHQGRRPTARTRSRPGNMFPSPGHRHKTRPEIYAMGFRNPYRIQVDDNDVAYITDYSPDSEHAAELPRPGRHRPRRDRAQAVQLRLAALL